MNDQDIATITALVKDYYEGMLYGQADRLRQVFDADARLSGFLAGEEIHCGREDFIGMVAGPEAPSGGEAPYNVRIELLDQSGPVAVVKVVDDFRGLTFTDYLTLLRNERGWRIVHKGFYSWN